MNSKYRGTPNRNNGIGGILIGFIIMVFIILIIILSNRSIWNRDGDTTRSILEAIILSSSGLEGFGGSVGSEG